MNCAECNAYCCRGNDSLSLFAPEIKTFQELECIEGKDVRISQFGNMGYLETSCAPCPALDQVTNRCQIYPDRPMVCRVFPFALRYLPRGTCFDVSCPQHLPNTPRSEGSLDAAIAWFKVSRPRFMAGMTLRMLKDTWMDWVSNELSPKERQRLDEHEAKYAARAQAHAIQITRPVMPSDVLMFLGKLAEWAFDGFLKVSQLPLTARNLCEWAHPRMQVVALQLYQEVLEFR